MSRKKFAAEQIVTKLRQIEVMQGQGKSIAAACKKAGITEQSYYLCIPKTKSEHIGDEDHQVLTCPGFFGPSVVRK